MAPPSDPFPLPIVDHHAHLRPGPSGLEAARRFAALGGTHLFLATQSYGPGVPGSLEEYREQFETTLDIAKKVQETASVSTYPVVAPYPVDLLAQAERLGLAAAEELQRQALREAARLVEEGRAVALGEVGRAHFPIPEKVQQSQAQVLREAVALARDVGCPVVLHTEDLDGEGFRGLEALARQEGLSPERLVKHYARKYWGPVERFGITPSFLAKRPLVRQALADPGPWFLETDYLDDPGRPGAVLSLETVPRRVRELWEEVPGGSPSGELERRLAIPFVEAPRRLYGLSLSRPSPFRFTGPGGGDP
jgi:TatD-related deoxyribonuclease